MLYQILFNVIILLFPLLVNLFYCTYNNNINKEQNKLYLDVSLLSSLYLLLIFNKGNNELIILFNIPLIFSFIKRRTFVSFIITFIILSNYLETNITIYIVEYLIYYLIYFFYRKNILNLFLIIKFIFNFDIFTSVIFIIITYLVI